MLNVILTHPLAWFGSVAASIKEKIGGQPEITASLEQVLALVKENSVSKICLMVTCVNGTAGESVQKIHALNPNIPILIWNAYKPAEASANELYLSAEEFGESFLEVTKKFFDGILNDQDLALYKGS